MTGVRIALALSFGLAAACPALPVAFAEESHGAAAPDIAKAPKKRDRQSSRAPSEHTVPGTKPESAKIIFF